MADTNKIFKNLQQFAVNPPPELYPELWQKINSLPQPDKDLLQLIQANAGTDTGTHLTATSEEFTALQSYIDKDNIPPPFDLQKIKEALANSTTLNAAPRKSVTLRWLYRSVAAAILITGIALIYVNKGGNKETTVAGSNEQAPHPGLVKKEHPEQIKDSSPLINKKYFAVKTKKGNDGISQQGKQTPVAAVNSTSSVITLLNNDFFYTLTNFNTSEAVTFFSDWEKDKKVTVNNYCYVNISDEMASFLKQSYAVNRKKKYTWKARRMRAKLNRWKKADEKYFDNGPDKDPLDITDLSEFLFKHK